MAIYAIVNKETNLVTNTIGWDGHGVTVPDTEMWVLVPDNTSILFNKTQYINGQFENPTEEASDS